MAGNVRECCPEGQGRGKGGGLSGPSGLWEQEGSRPTRGSAGPACWEPGVGLALDNVPTCWEARCCRQELKSQVHS